jgi:hypothetical protein
VSVKNERVLKDCQVFDDADFNQTGKRSADRSLDIFGNVEGNQSQFVFLLVQKWFPPILIALTKQEEFFQIYLGAGVSQSRH